jgi:hypothetical protein
VDLARRRPFDRVAPAVIWTGYLVTMWLCVDYPYGLTLFFLGGAAHWTLKRLQEVIRVRRHAYAFQRRGEVA